jgi:Ca2+-binding RTX toxin-like protein
MATEPTPTPPLPTEGPQLPKVVNPIQGTAIGSILGNFDSSTASSAPGSAPGTTKFTDADGHSYVAVDAGGASSGGAKKFKLKDLDPGTPAIVDGYGLNKIKGAKTNDSVINVSNDDLKFKLGAGNDQVVSTGFGAVQLEGGTGSDTLVGGNGDDLIRGGSEDDFLAGSAGSDTIAGGSGADTIEGGQGNDLLKGGADGDIFVFDNEPTGADVITDFSAQDTLRIVDRNGDGDVTQGDGGDFFTSVKGGDLIVHLLDANGLENGRITLKGAGNKTLNEDSTDGDFSF